MAPHLGADFVQEPERAIVSFADGAGPKDSTFWSFQYLEADFARRFGSFATAV
jgi:hypothetical protein